MPMKGLTMITFDLDNHSTTPLYEQIYQHIKQAILTGKLQTGEKLPSTRSLSSHLQVSRNTIDMAYSQLLSEGYVDSIPQKGYYVNAINNLSLSEKSQSSREQTSSSQSNRTNYKPIQTKSEQILLYDFSPNAIDTSHFPYSIWKKLMKNALDQESSYFLLGDNQGDYSFRLAIQHYLEQSRGVNCDISQIVVGAGADYLLQLLSQLLNPSDIIAMEDPSYTQANLIFNSMHIRTTAIPVDAEGMNVSKLRQTLANIAYVTPSHQFPLGSVMSIKRRLELLQWAKEDDNRYIIEDDHDSEFRYVGRPIPALQSLDTSQKVIYIGTFSRSIAPAIRVGYMVLPFSLYTLYKERLSHYSSTVSRLDQKILTDFMEQGHFERHLNRMKKHYKTKHDTMLEVLQGFGNVITVIGENAGLHLVVQVNLPITEQELIYKAKKRGIGLYPISPYYINTNPKQKAAFLMGFTNLKEQDIKDGLMEFYNLLTQK